MNTREGASASDHRALAAHRAVTRPAGKTWSRPPPSNARNKWPRPRRPHLPDDQDDQDDQEDETPTSLEEIRSQQRQAKDSTRIAVIVRGRAERTERPAPTTAPARRQAE
ncbi:hypothetical protein ABZ383_34155 [Streptomyces sp. NPDC005900]|uniref:hypothetical protein n=1 Tax=Streptomyces sp. NPDC005900 TaxID=3154569 RepID=UPI0033C7643C